VWYEQQDSAETAIKKEKQIKRWLRQWKIELIEKENPQWEDLYEKIVC
jgi:putative endonuclease